MITTTPPRNEAATDRCSPVPLGAAIALSYRCLTCEPGKSRDDTPLPLSGDMTNAAAVVAVAKPGLASPTRYSDPSSPPPCLGAQPLKNKTVYTSKAAMSTRDAGEAIVTETIPPRKRRWYRRDTDDNVEVVVHVPTYFTNASGRSICVRERRVLTADSPYWGLLKFSPSRTASCTLSSGADEMPSDEHALSLDPPEATQRFASPCSHLDGRRASTRVSRSSHRWDAVLDKPPTRASSCPQRFYNDSMTYVEASLPAFSGFTRANGSPVYLSSSFLR